MSTTLLTGIVEKRRNENGFVVTEFVGTGDPAQNAFVETVAACFRDTPPALIFDEPVTFLRYGRTMLGVPLISLYDIAEGTAELQRAAKLGLKGAMIAQAPPEPCPPYTSPLYDPFWAAAQELDMPIILHVITGGAESRLSPSSYWDPNSVLGAILQPHEAQRTMAQLILSGVLERFPNLKVVLGHLGEGLPFHMQRLNLHVEMDAAHRGLKKTPLRYLRENMIITTSGNFSIPAFMCCYLEMGPDNILFSVDWPFVDNPPGTDWMKQVPLGKEDMAKIYGENAARLLKL